MLFRPWLEIEFFIHLCITLPVEGSYRLASVHLASSCELRNGVCTPPISVCCKSADDPMSLQIFDLLEEIRLQSGRYLFRAIHASLYPSCIVCRFGQSKRVFGLS